MTQLNGATSAAWAALRSCLRPSNWARERHSVPWQVDWEAARRRRSSRHLPRYRVEGRSPATAQAIAAPGWADRWTPAWPRRLPAATAAAALRAWWFPASPVRRLACPAAVEAAPWRCLPREATRPAWADRAVAGASDAATDRAAASLARERAPARKAPAQDQTPWRAVESLLIPGPAARAPEPVALLPCPASRSRVAAATS